MANAAATDTKPQPRSRRRGAHVRSRRSRHRSRTRVLVIVAVVVVVVGGGVAGAAVAQLRRSVPAPVVDGRLSAAPAPVPDPADASIPWPTQGAAGLWVPGVVGFPAQGTSGPVPIASITKVMTTLTLLRLEPLSVGEQGPTIPVTAADVYAFKLEASQGDSVAPLVEGEQLTEYQAITQMLVASANDVAQLVAQWAAGSIPAFVADMNSLAQQWGLHDTTFADPTGLDADTRSSVDDLLQVAQRAMADPIVRQVVALPSVSVPGQSNPLPNTDLLLGHDGIVGIKTGSEQASGGCFLFAASVPVRGVATLAYGVVLGQQGSPGLLAKAFARTTVMVTALRHLLAGATLVHRGQVVAHLRGPDGHQVALVAAGTATTIAPPGTTYTVLLHTGRLRGDAPVPAGRQVGTLTVTVAGQAPQSVTVTTAGSLAPPSTTWRLLRR